MRKRLRDKYSDEELKNIYKEPHRHILWQDHVIRVEKTIDIINKNCGGIESCADLSAGDAHIINSINCKDKFIGDYAPKYDLVGPIEETIHKIPNVDLFICSETLEHLDDPDKVLCEIRNKSKMLVVTTPEGKFDDENPEHYWAWDSGSLKEMLIAAGFDPFFYEKIELSQYYYDFQVWVCK